MDSEERKPLLVGYAMKPEREKSFMKVTFSCNSCCPPLLSRAVFSKRGDARE